MWSAQMQRATTVAPWPSTQPCPLFILPRMVCVYIVIVYGTSNLPGSWICCASVAGDLVRH